MVRKCFILACSTVLACGAAASADTKAAGKVATAQPTTLREVAANWNEALVGTASSNAVGTCADLWFNGAFDQVNGQASHRGGAYANGVQVADDIWLCDGFVYRVNRICGTLITNSIPAINKALVEVYADCDGMPTGTPLFTLKDGTFTVIGPYMMDANYRVVDWTFTLANQVDPKVRSIYLKGGAYWISLQGITDGQCNQAMNFMCDSSFWGSTNMVKGSIPKKRFGTPTGVQFQYNFTGPWSLIDDCCFGCTDMAFSFDATPCKILVDNGVADRVSVPGGSSSRFSLQDITRNDRTADDFVVPPCDPVTICYLEGCIYTNCDPLLADAVFEIYGNDCRYPAYCFGGAVLGTNLAADGSILGVQTKLIPLPFTTQFQGKTLQAYRAEFHDLNINLPGGKQYWVSIGVRYTYDLNTKTLWCYNADCARQCLIRWNPAQYLAPQSCPPQNNLRTAWVNVGRDMVFTIASSDRGLRGDGNTTGTCVADFNRNGEVTVQDVFDFLASWFTGCNP